MNDRPKMSKSRPTEAAATKPVNVADLESAIMNGGDKAKKKRLILDISPELHKRIKHAAVDRGISMVDEITPLLEAKYLI